MKNHLSPGDEFAITQLLIAFFHPLPRWSVLQISQGIVVEAVVSNEVYILKAMRGELSSIKPLTARLNWIRYLRQHGLAVPDLVLSQRENLVETISFEGRQYLAYAYAKIKLSPANTIDWSDRSLPVKLGDVMAKMHLLADAYQQSHPLDDFDHALSAPWLYPEGQLHPSQAALVEPIRRLREALESYPQDETIFGLVHDDLHTGNVFHVQGQLVILDFDCTVRHWYAAELASALLFRVWIGPEKEKLTGEATTFLKGVLQGYSQNRPLPLAWAEMLPVFLKLRELSQFWDYHKLDLSHAPHASLIHYLYESLLREKPFLHIDYRRV